MPQLLQQSQAKRAGVAMSLVRELWPQLHSALVSVARSIIKAPTLNYQQPFTLGRHRGERFSVFWPENAACRKLRLLALTSETTNACFFSGFLEKLAPAKDLCPFSGGGRSLHAEDVSFYDTKAFPWVPRRPPPNPAALIMVARQKAPIIKASHIKWAIYRSPEPSPCHVRRQCSYSSLLTSEVHTDIEPSKPLKCCFCCLKK